MEQVVTLIGQAINSMTFLRRKFTLTAKGSETPLQWLRETYSEELKESDDSLFGQKFVEKMKTQDPMILEIISGLRIPLINEPKQYYSPKEINFKQPEIYQIDLEIQSMLEKGAIREFNSFQTFS